MIVLTAFFALIALGLYGVLTRRDLIGVLASAEVMMGGALLLLVSIGASASVPSGHAEAIALLVLVLAAAEAAVGLALVVTVARSSRTSRVDELREVGEG